MLNNTTTSFLQKKPDFYNSVEECSESLKNKIQTNPRYKNFNQTHFTAGDEEQFLEYKYEKNGENKDVELKDNIYSDKFFYIWKGYHDLEAHVVLKTFRYIFNKFKKGIFVKIVNNELKVFLPFSNANFVNEWNHKIHYNGDKSIFNNISQKNFNEKNINNFKNTWYANNCLLRYEFPVSEGDTNVSIIKNMLDELCSMREVPDIEFFINRRDYPIITNGYYEPYFDLWDSKTQPLVSHKYENYLPILSMSSNKKTFADILMPSYEDWSRIQIKDNKFFPRSRSKSIDDNILWQNKKNIAIFRGSSTGSGVTFETNQRLKVSYLSYNNKIDKNDGLPFLNAGITSWNSRIKKIMGSPKLQSIDISKIPFSLVPYMTYEEQCEYKYILHIDGHVSAFRLSTLFSSNSLILIVESEWKSWISELIKPYVHYVPIKKDLSDIYSQISWCKNNDDKCKEISSNAKVFYEKYLQKDGVLDYMQKLLIDVKKQTGSYKYDDVSLFDYQSMREKEVISKIKSRFPNVSNGVCDIYSIPKVDRNYGLLKGIQYIFNYFQSINKSIEIEETKECNNVFTNLTIDIKKYKIKDFEIIIKRAKNEKKIKENIHESFVGLSCINKILKKIPNFCYIFGINELNEISAEYISGELLYDYVRSKDFDIQEFIFILLQICLVLEMAQNEFCFVHYDLTSWNIMLKKLDKEVEIDYKLSDGRIITIKTKVIPIIIDYGKSHVVYNGEHYGLVKMFTFSTCQDILSLLLTSVYQISVSQDLTKNDFDTLIYISNFISNTQYRRNKFHNFKDIKVFFRNAKKYSNLLYKEKYELESYKPIDMYYYLSKCYKKEIKESNHIYRSFMSTSNSYQIFYYILSRNKTEQSKSFLLSLTELKKSKGNFEQLDLICKDLLVFNNNKEKYKTIIKDVLSLKKSYDNIERETMISEDRLMMDINESQYDENILMESRKLKKIEAEYMNYDLDALERSMKANKDNSKIMNTIANIKTLRNIIKLYRN